MKIRKALFVLVMLSVLQISCAHKQKIETRFIAMETDAEFSQVLDRSLATILEFSKKNSLGIESASEFVSDVSVHGTKLGFNSFIRANGWPPKTPIPNTVVGAGQNKKLEIVSFKVYKEIFPQDSARDYQKLLTHELAHLAHAAFLKNQDDKMGPIWFYEGLACVIADQYDDAKLPAKEKLSEVLMQSERGSYRDYAPIVRALAQQEKVTDLMVNAASANFSSDSEKLLKEKGYK